MNADRFEVEQVSKEYWRRKKLPPLPRGYSSATWESNTKIITVDRRGIGSKQPAQRRGWFRGKRKTRKPDPIDYKLQKALPYKIFTEVYAPSWPGEQAPYYHSAALARKHGNNVKGDRMYKFIKWYRSQQGKAFMKRNSFIETIIKKD